MSFVNFNGKVIPAQELLFDANNRAFQYGDAIFETIRMFDGKIPFLEFHVNRLLQSLEVLKYQTPKKYTQGFFQKEIQKIASGNTRIRMTIYRSNGGLYTPKNNRPRFLITSSPLSKSKFELNKKGLEIDFFERVKLPCSPLSNLKTCNSLPYILAGLYKKEQNLDDVILLNEKDRISEASSSNIFLLQKNTLITPSLSEGCINGTMRKAILEIAKRKNLKTKTQKVTPQTLKKSDEIWLTNAIQGIRWISKVSSNFSFTKPKVAPIFVHELNHFKT